MEERKLNVSNTTYDCDLDILDFQIPWLHESRFTNCDICQKVLPIFELGNHRKHHFNSVEEKEVPLICPICGQSFQSNQDLKLHSKIHLHFKCEHCGICYNEKKSLVRHKIEMHLPKNWFKIEGFEMSKFINGEEYCLLPKLRRRCEDLLKVSKNPRLNPKYQDSNSTKIQSQTPQINPNFPKQSSRNPNQSKTNPNLINTIPISDKTQFEPNQILHAMLTRPKPTKVQIQPKGPKDYQIKHEINPKFPKINPIAPKINSDLISEKNQPKPTEILTKTQHTQIEPEVYQVITPTKPKPRPAQAQPRKPKLSSNEGKTRRRCDACQMGAFCENQHF